MLGDRGTDDLIAHAAQTRRLVDELGVSIEEIAAALNERMEYVEGRLAGTVSRASVIRYDAFNETSGRQSSTVALFDQGGNGVVISAILQRDQARVYAKPLVGGRSELELSPRSRRRSASLRRTGGGEGLYLGPTGTYNEEALLASVAQTPGGEVELEPRATIFDAIQAVEDGRVERAFVPFENSIEGSVRSTLDALAFDTSGVRIVGEYATPSATT